MSLMSDMSVLPALLLVIIDLKNFYERFNLNKKIKSDTN